MVQTRTRTTRRRVVPGPVVAPPVAEVEEPPPPVPVTESTAEELLTGYLGHRQQGKLHYEQADLLFMQLLSLVGKKWRTKKIKNPETGEIFIIVDNFQQKNTSYRPCGVNRFELKPVKGTKKPKAEANGQA